MQSKTAIGLTPSLAALLAAGCAVPASLVRIIRLGK